MANHAPGYITSSTVHKLLTGKSDKLLKGGRNFARQLARERFGVIDEESQYKGGDATDWGDYHEEDAIERYEQETLRSVHSRQLGVEAKLKDGEIVQPIDDDDKPWLSCTPDGYVSDDGLTEVKCHYNTDKHMSNLLNSAWLKTYEEQCRFQMMLTDRSWVDLISYDPRWTKPMDIHWVTLERDPQWEEFCMDRIEQAEKIINKTLKELIGYEKDTNNTR